MLVCSDPIADRSVFLTLSAIATVNEILAAAESDPGHRPHRMHTTHTLTHDAHSLRKPIRTLVRYHSYAAARSRYL